MVPINDLPLLVPPRAGANKDAPTGWHKRGGRKLQQQLHRDRFVSGPPFPPLSAPDPASKVVGSLIRPLFLVAQQECLSTATTDHLSKAAC